VKIYIRKYPKTVKLTFRVGLTEIFSESQECLKKEVERVRDENYLNGKGFVLGIRGSKYSQVHVKGTPENFHALFMKGRESYHFTPPPLVRIRFAKGLHLTLCDTNVPDVIEFVKKFSKGKRSVIIRGQNGYREVNGKPQPYWTTRQIRVPVCEDFYPIFKEAVEKLKF